MKSKKVIAGLLSVTILSLSSTSAIAAGTQEVRTISAVEQVKEAVTASGSLNKEKKPYFNFFSGSIKEIKDYKAVEGSKIILVESKGGELANIILSKDTYVLNNAEIKLGSSITGYYKADAPMIMIYPMQLSAEVVVVADDKNQNVKVEVFDKGLVSADNMLKLNISDDTEIVSQDGKPYKGKLENRKLVVTYGISTKSIPAQTTPTKIVVLNGGVVKDNDKAKANKHRTMVQKTAIRMIAEILGFDIDWNGKVIKYNSDQK
jgi:hypothetical protein